MNDTVHELVQPLADYVGIISDGRHNLTMLAED